MASPLPIYQEMLVSTLEAVGMPGEAAGRLAVGSGGDPLASALPVDGAALACVGAALLSAAALVESRDGTPSSVELDVETMRAAVTSERHFAVEGGGGMAGFASLSRFWPAADGWVRTHANFPWHREALLRAVGASSDEEVEDAISSFGAAEVEDRTFAAGGVAAAVRTAAEWSSSPAGRAVAGEPLVGIESFDGAPSRRRSNQFLASGVPLPLAGVRVLDLTRVIAGPVASRYLGALGAEVLRIDAPDRPDLELGSPADTLLAKRSAMLDLASPASRERLEALLGGADVVLLGYRPGALDRFGLAPPDLAERHPGLVIGQLAAWGHSGPWAGRRGFDSIVQAASGIAMIEASADGDPGALPCQLLDHGAGYLMAAAVLVGLREGEVSGGTRILRLSLARTAAWLMEHANASFSEAGDNGEATGAGTDAIAPIKTSSDPPLVKLDSSAGAILAVPPPGALDGFPLRWPAQASVYGADDPEWLSGSRGAPW